MKILKRFALPVLFLLNLLPVLHQALTLFYACGAFQARLTFERYPLPYAIVLFLLALLCAAMRRQIMPDKGFGKVCALFLLPVTLLNALVSCFHNSVASGILLALSCICALIIFLVAPNKKWKRILCHVFSFVLALLVTVSLPLSLLFGNFGASTVVQTVKSPDGTYIATLTDQDVGALGGCTQVIVMKRPIPLIFGQFTSRYYSQNEAWAGAGVLADMRFEWADNVTLLYGESELNFES